MRVFAGKHSHCRDKAATAGRFVFRGKLSPSLSADPWTVFVFHNGFWSCVQQEQLQPLRQLLRWSVQSLYLAGLGWHCSAFEDKAKAVPVGGSMSGCSPHTR
jgi:hypothetical protein